MKIGVGVDVSKGKSTICIISSDGEIIEMQKKVIKFNFNKTHINYILLTSYKKI